MQDTHYGLNNGDECNDNDPCTSSGVPGPWYFQCAPNVGCEPVTNGVNCTDDNLCTANDTCQQGVCVGESVTCGVPQGCFNSTCSALTGQCQDECPPPLAPVTPVMTPVTPIASPHDTCSSTLIRSHMDVPGNSGGTPVDVPEATPVMGPVATPVKAPRAKISGSQMFIVLKGFLLSVIALVQ